MDNKNLPAYPLPITCNENGIYSTLDCPSGGAGLTKLEMVSAMCLQGLLANSTYGGIDTQSVVMKSAEFANILLTYLSTPEK